MLIKLLRVHLRPYRTPITLVVLFQFLQTIATLYLPALNADIIDNGVIKGDTGYVMQVGAGMLGITVLQIATQAVAVYFGARTAMAVGRDLRASIFDRVQTFSAREVVITVNAIMGEYFSAPYPARSTIEVSALPKGAVFEIDAVMVLGAA